MSEHIENTYKKALSSYTKYAFDHPENQRRRKRSLQIISNVSADHSVWALRIYIRKKCLAQNMLEVILKKNALQKDKSRIASNVFAEHSFVSELLKRLYKQKIFSHNIRLRWSWKTTLSNKNEFQIISDVHTEHLFWSPWKSIKADNLLTQTLLEVILENNTV